MKKTEYQKTHKPVKVVENKCSGKPGIDGLCGWCGRAIKRAGKHFPNMSGHLGYTEVYADGSTRECNENGK